MAVLADGADGDLLMVGDGQQSLYRQRPFTWKSLGIQAQGRSKILRENYRNRETVVALAAHLASFMDYDAELSQFANTFIALDAVRRPGGFLPFWQNCESWPWIQAQIIAQVQVWQAGFFRSTLCREKFKIRKWQFYILFYQGRCVQNLASLFNPYSKFCR